MRRTPIPLLLILLLLPLLFACADTEPEGSRSDTSDTNADTPTDASRDPRPSIALIVVESLRTDALESYGRDSTSPLRKILRKSVDEPKGTTGEAPDGAAPNFDALARTGRRYDWAIAAAPETIASHASILTGLRPDQHGVSVWQETIAPDSLEFIAERLASAGYETAAFVENPMLNGESGLLQGFAQVASPRIESAVSSAAESANPADRFDLVSRVRKWSEKRDPNRPYFLFINLFDPHLPLAPDPSGRFVPPNATRRQLEELAGKEGLRNQICNRLPESESLELIRALYLSEVVRADRKLGSLLEILKPTTPSGGPITIATADHGTHLGERSLLGHEFALDNRVLRVPLVVNGPSVPVGVIESPVALRRVAESILCWAGEGDRCLGGLPRLDGVDGVAGAEGNESEPIYSIASETRSPRPATAFIDTGSTGGAPHHGRVYCAPDSGLFGRAVSIIRSPLKFVWREIGEPHLYDLSWDPHEKSDQFGRGEPVKGQRARLSSLKPRSSSVIIDSIAFDSTPPPDHWPSARESLSTKHAARCSRTPTRRSMQSGSRNS